MAKSKVVDIDKGWRNIGRGLKQFSGHEIFVGLPQDSPESQEQSNGLTMAALGTIHEFGTYDGFVPARRWLSAATDYYRDAIADRYVKLWKRIMTGKRVDVGEGLERIGMFGVNRVREYIRKVGPTVWEPLADRTVKDKKDDRPLISTGQLIRAITYVVKRKPKSVVPDVES